MDEFIGLIHNSRPSIETYTGRFINPLDIKVDDINILDIVHSLSNLCRFSGHCCKFYSVAQHSVIVCKEVRKCNAEHTTIKAALLHDATEAYIGDVVRPIKYSLPEIKRIESVIAKAIIEKFELHNANWHLIKNIDDKVLAIEADNLMNSNGYGWKLPRAIPFYIQPLSPRGSKTLFKQYLRRVGIEVLQ